MSKFLGFIILIVSTVSVPLSGVAGLTLIGGDTQPVPDDGRIRIGGLVQVLPGDPLPEPNGTVRPDGGVKMGSFIVYGLEPVPQTSPTAPTSSIRPEPRPEILSLVQSELAPTTSPRPQARPMTEAERLNQIYDSGYSSRGAAADRLGYENTIQVDASPDVRVREGALNTGDRVRIGGMVQVKAEDLEQKAYQVSGVTFYGANSAAEASRLTGAPIREIWVSDVVQANASSARVYNSRAMLEHRRDITDVNFTNSFIKQDVGNVARSDVTTAGGLVTQASYGVSKAQEALSRAQNMSPTMGVVKDAAIAEAEKALAEAEEALRLAQEALAKAEAEKAEDEAAADDDDEP